jgi:gamma-glutamylcyclotransferase (GGCT)/AIG2-like uncharacterized protein YtfP
MNTNRESMALRCPKAEDLGLAELPNYQFEFYGHATVIPTFGEVTYGVLWNITDQCEQYLDLLEEYPTYYDKHEVKVVWQGQVATAMTYRMVGQGRRPPSLGYVAILEQGYQEHGLPMEQLDLAWQRSCCLTANTY